MPERSAEIEQVLRTAFDALARSNIDEIGRHTSRDPCVVAIGSDPSEWVEGYEQYMQLFRESTPNSELGVTAGCVVSSSLSDRVRPDEPAAAELSP